MRPDTPTAPACGCDEHPGLSRRTVVRGMGAGLLMAGAMSVAGPNPRYAFGADAGADVLVVLSLRGGFDGLSAVAPLGDPNYATLRGRQALAASTAIQLDQTFALHPSLGSLQQLWTDGKFGVVVDVGQPAETRSHFQAIAELEKAAPGSTVRSGWIDRLGSVLPGSGAFTVTQVGSQSAPQSFGGPQPEMTMARIDQFTLSRASEGAELAAASAAIRAVTASGPAQVSGPVNAALDALSTVAGVRANTGSPYPVPAAYPRRGDGNPTDLSIALADTARLIKNGTGLRVATLDAGNWDMHEWAGVNDGWMRDQLKATADALAAFVTDLGTDFARTTVVTISEFGRRAAVNGTSGFDHGHGNQMLLLGGGINGKTVHGQWSGLGAANLVQGDLPGRNDYRAVLGSILTNRLGVSASGLSTVFPGGPSTLIDVAKQR